ncbi:hypothetical protein OAD21_04200 [Amylibacter sp.]|jgi:hypothetical protein|nr:hypothetical protein [Amylibacter sp.]MDB4146934.1 hypothetical protein [Amylibacter sp.]MDB9919361.1 hypothetical protein [Amylibacter sp.]MDC1414451.1 hypothetical protein [Amylibacter sp.]|tara:strand:- start:7060 stop:7341 length:282 start_codon:yes stop_codon:yes gene_type:complete
MEALLIQLFAGTLSCICLKKRFVKRQYTYFNCIIVGIFGGGFGGQALSPDINVMNISSVINLIISGGFCGVSLMIFIFILRVIYNDLNNIRQN